MKIRMCIGALLLMGLIPISFAAAQTEAPPDAEEPSADPPSQRHRADWISDHQPLRVGDLITVFLDERTTATERVSRTATSSRSRQATLNAALDGESVVGQSAVQSGHDADSRDVGEAGRRGDLTGVVTVRVIAVDEEGIAEISGSKMLTVDGREQEITVTGFVRPIDVGPTRVIDSNRIADSKITYRGKDIGPKGGIIGKIISMLWP